MFDPTSVLVSNLGEALKQVTNYLTIGLATAVSALMLNSSTDEKSSTAEKLSVPYLLIPVDRGTAQMLLLGLSWISGAMASYAIDAANKIAADSIFKQQPDVLRVACSFPSLLTAPIGYGILAAALPVIFVIPVFWKMHKAVRVVEREGSPFITFLLFFLIPYGAVALGLWKSNCQ